MKNFQNIRQVFLHYLNILCMAQEPVTNDVEIDWYLQEGHPKQRRQLQTVSFYITNPSETKEIEGVPARKVPWICSEETGIDYFQELMNPDRGSYEYTYGERIASQLSCVIEKLKGIYSNNAQIVIASPYDHRLTDRPCLQVIDFKRLPYDLLNMSIYFRSWDIFALPYNLIGLVYLFEHVCDETDLELCTLYGYSSGLNIRDEMLNTGKDVTRYLQI